MPNQDQKPAVIDHYQVKPDVFNAMYNTLAQLPYQQVIGIMKAIDSGVMAVERAQDTAATERIPAGELKGNGAKIIEDETQAEYMERQREKAEIIWREKQKAEAPRPDASVPIVEPEGKYSDGVDATLPEEPHNASH